MATLEQEVTRILSELEGRGSAGSLTADVVSAINTAIAEYSRENFFFLQDRDDHTFSASAGQEFYSATLTLSWIAGIIAIDSITLTTGTTSRFPIERRSYDELELLSVNTASRGEPSRFSYYAQQLRFYPIPDQAYPIRVSGIFAISPDPLSATGDTNVWLTTGEKLIREAAKKELALNVLLDPEQATMYAAAEAEAYAKLRRANTTRLSSGRVRATSF